MSICSTTPVSSSPSTPAKNTVTRQKTGEEVTGETDEFLFYLNLVIVLRTSVTKQNSSVSTATSRVLFLSYLDLSQMCRADGFRQSVVCIC